MVSKASSLPQDVSKPTDTNYNLDHACCYFCTLFLGTFLKFLSHWGLADWVLILCPYYNPSELCRTYFRLASWLSLPKEENKNPEGFLGACSNLVGNPLSLRWSDGIMHHFLLWATASILTVSHSSLALHGLQVVCSWCITHTYTHIFMEKHILH